MDRNAKVLYVGPDYPGSNGTLWRNAFLTLGCDVRTVDEEKLTAPPANFAGRVRRKLRGRPHPAQIAALNREVARAASDFRPDFIFYIKAYFVLPETIAETKKYGPAFAYMNDDMFLPGVSTFTFRYNIKLFDCVLTTKSFSVGEYARAGAPWTVYVPNAYDPAAHYPVKPQPTEIDYFQSDVSFIGDFGPSKADALACIAEWPREMSLNVWGNWSRLMRIDNFPANRRWRKLQYRVRGRSLFCEDMGKAIGSSKISLGLLRREVRDLHTSRSFEIPACGGFMLAHRTEEHKMFFEEDREAVYFSTHEEMMDKIRFYLANEPIREKIAAAGHQRCLRSGPTYTEHARLALQLFRTLRPLANNASHSVCIHA